MGGDKNDKTTIMVLKVDLHCSSCYKKVKKILCKFPQIRDQIYDEKANTVTITVVCCNPEKLRDKLCSKGCGVIKSIEIKEPPKPKVTEKPKQPEKPKELEKPKQPEKTKEPEKPKQPEKLKEPEKPKQPEKQTVVIEKPKEPEKPTVVIIEKPQAPEKPKEPEKPKKPEKSKTPEKPKEVEKPKPKEAPKPQPVVPPLMPMPIQEYPPPPPGYCCGQCYEGHSGGPCYQWYGRPAPPPLCHDNYGYCCGQCYEGHTGGPCYQWYGRTVPPHPCYDNFGPGPYGYGRCCNVSRCECFNDENVTGCSIM